MTKTTKRMLLLPPIKDPYGDRRLILMIVGLFAGFVTLGYIADESYIWASLSGLASVLSIREVFHGYHP